MQERGLLGATLGLEETTRYYAVEQLQQSLPTVNLRSGKPGHGQVSQRPVGARVELMQVATDITRRCTDRRRNSCAKAERKGTRRDHLRALRRIRPPVTIYRRVGCTKAVTYNHLYR